MEWTAFVAKKIVSALVYPVMSSVVLVVAGLFLCTRTTRGRLGYAFITGGALWLAVAATPLTGWILVRPLEDAAGSYANAQDLIQRDVRRIVVLGGDLRPGDLTPADRIAYTTLARFMEAYRLWRHMPESVLVLSGGSRWNDVMSNAQAMALLAEDLGVPKDRIVIERASRDTEDEAVLLASMLEGRPFALVTSAVHMPRALANFKRLGLDPIPAPADFHTKGLRLSFDQFLPDAGGVAMTQRAIHEYLGLLQLRLEDLVVGAPEAPSHEAFRKTERESG